jgi:cysteinyl-tRNA synthetase
VHGEFLLMAGRKMAKSAGNFQRVTELADRGLDPLAFRYLALTSRYGRKLNYSDASLKSAAAGLASLRSRLAALGPPPKSGPWAAPAVLTAGVAGDRPGGTAVGVAGFGGATDYPVADRAHEPSAPLSPAGRDLHDRFVAALDDDLDLPGALASAREMLRADLPADERRWLVLDADAVLGLDLHRVWEGPSAAPETDVPADVAALVAARDAARAARDYALADELRQKLSEKGWDVVDGPGGSTATRRI